jgi:hypothetical protein
VGVWKDGIWAAVGRERTIAQGEASGLKIMIMMMMMFCILFFYITARPFYQGSARPRRNSQCPVRVVCAIPLAIHLVENIK